MDNAETLTTLGKQGTWPRQTKI